MTFGLDLTEIIRAIGVLGVAIIIFAESGLLIGFFLPGDSLLFATGILAHEGVLPMNIHLLVLILFVAAVLGDSVGYTFGRRVGPRIFRREDSLLFHRDNVLRAQRFYERFGAITITLARFVPIVRTFAPIVAGVGNMRYQTFLLYNIIGGLVWAAGITYLGYFSGAFLENMGIEIDHFVLPVVVLMMLLTLLSPIVHLLRDPKSRAMLRQKFKKNSSPPQE